MASHTNHRRFKNGVTSVFPLFSLAVAAACNQEPAFVETTRAVTSEDMATVERGTEGDRQRVSEGRKGEGPDVDGAKGQPADGKDSSSPDGQGVSLPDFAVSAAQNKAGREDAGPSGSKKDTIAEKLGDLLPDGTRAGRSEVGGKDGDADDDGSRAGRSEKGKLEAGTEDVVVVPAPSPAPTQAPVASKPSQPEAKAGNEVVVNSVQTGGKVDILWVVDDSGSMAWAQSQLNSKFESFAQKLQDANVDFRVGVTSTDVCDIDWKTGTPKPDALCPESVMISAGVKKNGKMVGPLRGEFVTDSQTNQKVLLPGAGFVDAFKRVTMLGTSGSAMEHGLTAAKYAVQKAMSGVNSGFLRNDAFLSVIVLSDEEDDGVQMWCEDAWGRTSLTADGKQDLTLCKEGGKSPFLDVFQKKPYALMKDANGKPMTQYKFTADNFVSFLNDSSVKGEGKFRLSAITGVRGSDGKIVCNSPYVKADEGPLESGTNYIKAAQLTGGVVENICAPDWAQILSNIGQNVSQLSSKIELPKGKIPFPGTLEVYVNGKALSSSKFQYESQGNFLSFNELPPANAQIRIVFKETIH